MIQFVLMDVEGTTTSIDFVHQTLFPYAAEHLRGFVHTHQEEEQVKQVLAEVQSTIWEEEGQEAGLEDSIDQLLDWIRKDRKHPALKRLQGYIWKDGYQTGAYQGHVYPDVVPAWKVWLAEGRRLGIYSSGSVEAQKLLFAHSIEGDLTPFLSAHFDTGVGHKKEVTSYQTIATELDLSPRQIGFLSDVPAELDAARDAGMLTCHVVRPGTPGGDSHPEVPDFSHIRW